MSRRTPIKRSTQRCWWCRRAAPGATAAARTPANAEFANNGLLFDQLVARVRYPTAAIFFAEDEFEPGDRGTNAVKTLTEHHVANLIIDHPSGFAGRGFPGVAAGVRL